MKTASPFSRFLAPAFRVSVLSVVTFCVACPLATPASQSAHISRIASQGFICDTGLDHNECLQNVAQLRAELLRYSANLPRQWSWVIVGSEDWQSLMLKLHIDKRSPAFTAIEARQSFLEGALFLPKTARTDELVRNLGVPVDQLLTVAVSHELGHAICGAEDEAIAKKVSAQLRSGAHIDCTSSLTLYDELYLRGRSPGLRSR